MSDSDRLSAMDKAKECAALVFEMRRGRTGMDPQLAMAELDLSGFENLSGSTRAYEALLVGRIERAENIALARREYA